MSGVWLCSGLSSFIFLSNVFYVKLGRSQHSGGKFLRKFTIFLLLEAAVEPGWFRRLLSARICFGNSSKIQNVQF